MLLKVIGLLIAISVAVALIYILGRWIYDHTFNAKRRDAAELEYQANRLDKIIRKAQREL